ncbi:unnamed protein product [Cuscuta epithymum]|uniref:F-box domain-containing protein n=1 Tax=Cuscuta epithymum TaxID=186058 RepID=A0AAV0EZC2_9ASTE|nr:unnamed protein product [Cuscuta epithymum]
MAFECQQSTETSSDNSGISKAEHNLSGSSTNQGYTLYSDIQKPVLKLNAKHCVSITNGDGIRPTPRSINDLPQALISEILNCLDPKELGIVSCVNSSLYQVASEHQVWEEFYCERWGNPTVPIALGPDSSGLKTKWKDLFVEREFRSKTFLGRYTVDTLYGHTEAVRAVFILSSKKLLFTSGYDQIVRMWDLEEGFSVSSSRPLGCTVRAVTADSKLLLAGGTDGFIHGWRAEEGNTRLLFDFKAPQNQNTEFRLWEHQGPITCLAVAFNKIYSGSWDMTVRVWDRSSLKCLTVLMHNDWVWSLAPHDDTTVATTSGSSIYLWDAGSGMRLSVIDNAQMGNVYSLARSHTGKLIFTGGEDGTIHMFDVVKNLRLRLRKVAMWAPHSGPVYSLVFEFPWLVSASSDGKLALIDVRKLLKTSKYSASRSSYKVENLNHHKGFSRFQADAKSIEPPQRMLHGFGSNLFAVDVGLDRIVCAGEEGAVRIWNFSHALEIEERVRALRGLRLENRMRRRKLNGKGGDQCCVAAKKNQINGDRNGWQNKRRVSGKLKA